jgi:hypothetical protein
MISTTPSISAALSKIGELANYEPKTLQASRDRLKEIRALVASSGSVRATSTPPAGVVPSVAPEQTDAQILMTYGNLIGPARTAFFNKHSIALLRGHQTAMRAGRSGIRRS